MPTPSPTPRPPNHRSKPSRVSTKGQVTIPKPVRDALGIAPGSAVEFEVTPSGDVVLRKRPDSARPLRGFLSDYTPDGPAPTAEDLDAGIGREVARLHEGDTEEAGDE